MSILIISSHISTIYPVNVNDKHKMVKIISIYRYDKLVPNKYLVICRAIPM